MDVRVLTSVPRARKAVASSTSAPNAGCTVPQSLIRPSPDHVTASPWVSAAAAAA